MTAGEVIEVLATSEHLGGVAKAILTIMFPFSLVIGVVRRLSWT